MSYNILTKHSWRCKQPNNTQHFHEWGYRRNRIQEVLTESKADVILLQEIDTPDFEEDFAEFAASTGYGFSVQKKKGTRHTMGVATLYRKEKFRERFSESHSRVLVVGLELADAECQDIPLICVANCHLEGHPKKENERVNQIRPIFKSLRKHGVSDAARARVLVAGDFNCTSDMRACALLEEGHVERHEALSGDIVKNSVAQKAVTHDFRFSNAYSGLDFPTRVPEIGCGWSRPIDHIFYTASTMNPISIRQPISEDELNRIRDSESGFPDETNPSDHVPVAAIFQL
eukprot:733244_1